MKKLLIFAATALVALHSAAAQEVPAIPIDDQVRIGHLDNGLTYYIRHNEEPKGQANFYIAQKVGSILEDDNQRGLAHFLEHMCFNGTEKFPGNRVIQYCESIGVKFGNDLNAYTSIDETVYNIDNVPVAATPSAVDSCLWILHDWADGLLLENDDIDHERGVIHEEWRSRMNSAQLRMYEKILPEIFPDGNRYGLRLPIGTMEVVDNFPYQALRDYYEKWYRPDQQGVVVVGDIDVDQVEAKIKAIFGTIAMPENPAERFYVQVPDNDETIVSIAKDKEQPYCMAYLFCKHDSYPREMRGDLNYLVYQYAVQMADNMIAQRLQELTMLPEPPFVQGSVDDENFFISTTKSAYTGLIIGEDDTFLNSIAAVYREMLRAARNGFTASEYERARAEYLTYFESAYNQREKKRSAEYCSEYVRHFIDNEPIPGLENGFALAQQLAPNIPVEVVNSVIAQFVGNGNVAIALMLPEKEGMVYPDEAQVKAVLASVEAEDIPAYEDAVSDEPLMSELPAAGKVKKVKDFKFGYKKYVLSNGVTVYLRSTDFNKDQIAMRAFSEGGLSLYPASESVNLKSLSSFLTVGGVGSFSQTDLTKVLAGKKVSVNPYVNVYNEGINGSTTPKDFETMLQLTNLYFTSLRSDNDAFLSTKNRMRALLLNAEAQPDFTLQEELYKTIYSSTDYIGNIKSSQVDDINYDRIIEIGRERFANAADFTFIFTGNIDEQTALPLIEQYIGSLPAKGKKEKAKKGVADFVKGFKEDVFDKEMEIPMATVVYVDNGDMKYNLKNQLSFDLAQQALSVVLLEEIREKEGGTYGISADGQIMTTPYVLGLFQIAYQTDPQRYEYLNSRVEEIVDQFAKEGPSAENLAKGKEYFLKNYRESLTDNYYYASVLKGWLDDKIDTYTDFEAVLESITAEDVRKVIADMLSQGNLSKVIMVGKEAAK